MNHFVPIPPPYPPVEKVLPHEGPMVLLDRIEEVTATFARASVRIREDSMFVEDGKVPAIVALEYIAQTIGVMLGTQALHVGAKITGGVLVGVQRLELVVEAFDVGDELRVTATYLWDASSMWKFGGRVERDGTPVAEGELSLLRYAADPGDLARLAGT